MDDIKSQINSSGAQPPTAATVASPAHSEASQTAADTNQADGLSQGDIAILKHKYSLSEHQAVKPKRRRTKGSPVVFAGLAVVTGAVLITLMLWVRHSGPAIEDASAAQTVPSIIQIGAFLETAEGSVEIDGLTASVQDKIELSSVIKTGDDSRAGIAFEDRDPPGSVIRLDRNSELDFSQRNNQTISAELTTKNSGIYVRMIAQGSRTTEISVGDLTFRMTSGLFQYIHSADSEGIRVYEGSVSVNGTETVPAGQQWFARSPDSTLARSVSDINISTLQEDAFLQWNIELDKSLDNSIVALGMLEDISPPELTIKQPADGDAVTTERATIVGSTEPNTTITARIGDSSPEKTAKTTSDGSGAFSITVELQLGANRINLTATDSAGNSTERAITVNRTTATVTLTIEGSNNANGILLTWSGAEEPAANTSYRVIYSADVDEPSFGESGVLSANTDDTTTLLPLKDGKTYFIRVCTYTQATNVCDNYSNTIRITAAESPSQDNV